MIVSICRGGGGGVYMDLISLLSTIFSFSLSPLIVSVSLQTVQLVEANVTKAQSEMTVGH